MAFKDNLSPLHGYEIRGLKRPSQEANTVFIDAIQKELTTGEQQMYQARLEAFLDTSEGQWLDYWGQWLGLHREGRDDDTYRNALKQHVLHKRNTITSIRETLALYLKTNIENIFIYEPWRDMFIYNSSKWNTYKCYPSTYYRYAVIDVQIDAPFNRTIAKLINLFRPAGVYWVITSLVNVLSKKAPIVDFTIDTLYHFISDDIDYVGFLQRHSNNITPDFFFNLNINNPFIYNNDLFNGGKVYYQARNTDEGIASIAPMYDGDTIPKDEDSRETAFSYIQPLKYGDTTLLSKVDGRGINYPFKATNANLATGVTRDANSNTYHIVANWINYHAKTNDNLFIYGQKTIQTYTSEINKYKVCLPKGTYTFSVNTEQVNFPFKLYVHVLKDTVNTDKDLSSEIFPVGSTQKYSVSFTLDNNATVELSPIYTDDVSTMGEYQYSRVQLQIGNVATADIIYQTPKAYLLGIHTQNNSEVNLHAMNAQTGLVSFYMDQENKENFDTEGRNWHIYRLPQDCTPTDFAFDTTDTVLNITLVPYREQVTFNPMPYQENSDKSAPLMGFIDFYDYYQDGQLMGANKRLAVLNEIDGSKIKNLMIYMKDGMGSKQNITAYVYDFMINCWVENSIFEVTDQYQVFKLSFLTLQNYLNENGLLFVKLVPESYDQNLAIDYFGFSYGNTTDDIDSIMPSQLGLAADTTTTSPIVVYPLTEKAKTDKDMLHRLLSITTILSQDNVPTQARTNLGSITYSYLNSYILSLDYTFDNSVQPLMLTINNEQSGESTEIDLTNDSGNQIGNVNVDLVSISEQHGITVNDQDVLSFTIFGGTSGNIHNLSINQISNCGKNLLNTPSLSLDSKGTPSSKITVTLNQNMGTFNFSDTATSDYILTVDNNNSALPDIVTLSFSAKGTGKITGVTLYNKNNDTNSSSSLNIALDDMFYQRISYTVIIGASNYNAYDFSLSGAEGQTISIKDIKVEQGVVSTPYN